MLRNGCLHAPLAPSPYMSRRDALYLLGVAGATLLGVGASLARAVEPMRTRPIPKTGEPLPVVGLGTWETFDVGEGAERGPLREVLRLLFEAGGTVIDSSPMYGRSEQVVGDLLAELGAREQAFLATKVWTSGRQRGMEQMRESLRRLRTGKLELMQVHNLSDWRVQLETLGAWKANGTFRYIGITHYTTAALDELADVLRAVPVDFVQIPYSIGMREPEQRFLPLAAERGAAVLVNVPFQKGALFRRVRGRALPEWAAEFDCASWGQFFLKYVLAQPAVTCVIPGTSDPRHLLDNVAAGRGHLPTDEQRRRMAQFWDAL